MRWSDLLMHNSPWIVSSISKRIWKWETERKREFVFFIRICDEDEEISLHQRIQRSRPAIYPSGLADTKPTPVYDIDE